MDLGLESADVTVTVCVPTFHRPERLVEAVRALGALTPPESGFEIVVVDDGSPPTDGIPALLEELARQLPVPLRWATQPNAGPGAARNRAWRMSERDWIAFTDDDCVPQPDWLVELLRAGDEVAADIVQGRTMPDPAQAGALGAPFARSMRVESLNGFYQTCNIAYRRSLLERLGGFDPAFRRSGEDTDLGWRAEEAGAVVTFADRAVVHHAVAVRSWRADLRDRRRWFDVPRVVARHPAARRLAWRRYIYRREHVVPLALLFGAPLLLHRSARRGWIALAASVLAADVVAGGGPSGAVARIQRRLGDGFETAVVLAGAVRARSLLL